MDKKLKDMTIKELLMLIKVNSIEIHKFTKFNEEIESEILTRISEQMQRV